VKPAVLFLSASLIGNAALIAVLATRSATPSPSATPSASSNKTPRDQSDRSHALLAALAAGDAKALEAAGVSPAIARELSIGRTFSRLAERVRAAQVKKADSRWWRGRAGLADPGAREQQLVARRELSDALIAAFGDDLGLAGGDQSQFAFLAPEKRDALRRINQDYDEMMAKFSGGGVQLASDREKLRLLRLERERDIAALLTPEERLAYDMRTSTSGNLVKNRYGDAIESEAEFQKIYALQKAFDDKFPRDALTGRISPEVMRTRAEAERQLEADIRAAVGDDRYAALRRAADPDVRTIDSLASRLNLPASTTDSVLASRDAYSVESQRITHDASLNMSQRRAQIQALATQARSEITRALGAEAADAYAQRSPWLNMLQNGMAYSTTPQDGTPGSLFPGASQSVYPVMPAGATAAGQRQFVINAAPPSDAVVPGDAFISGGNVQVMSFSSSASVDPAAGAAAPVRKMIVAPGQPAPAPQTATPTPRP
jgi:hypothetical protein